MFVRYKMPKEISQQGEYEIIFNYGRIGRRKWTR